MPKPSSKPKYKVGQKVFDLPSRKFTTVVERSEGEATDAWYYTVDNNIPLNPTRDGAFPNRDRCEFEICLPRDRYTALKDFSY